MFKLFPALRAIDLSSERLFPGIPDEIVSEGGPRAMRTWWVAPPGAGKTLVGRWLKVRHGWTVLTAARWSEVEIPEQGRVFVELASVEGITIEALNRISKNIRICVAAPREPLLVAPLAGPVGNKPPIAASTSVVPLPPPPPWVWMAGFHVLKPSPATTWIDALIGWVTARVKPGGGFDVERVRKLFQTEPFASLFETPGELLEFLGMVDDVGVDEIESVQPQPQRWIRAWLRAVMDRSDRPHVAGTTDLLRKRGDEILVHIELERLRRGLESALLEQDWAALIPPESAPPLDRDRLLALADSNAHDALEQIRVMLAPDPVSIMQGLRTAGVFEETGGDRLALRPTWVANTVSHIAIDRLLHGGPEGLGTLLLFPGTSEMALEGLINEVRAGDTDRVAACATLRNPHSPEQMAALNGAFRATGLALLTGADVPQALIIALWERQMSYVAQRFMNWPPEPVLAIASSERWHGVGSIGAWFLAAVEISRTLSDSGIAMPCTALNPWSRLPETAEEHACCMEALNNIGLVFGRGDPRRLAVYRLGGDLLDRHGVLRRNSTLLDLQAPDLLVELASGKQFELSDAERDALLMLPFGLQALEDTCRRRPVLLDGVLTWCWSQWSTETWRFPPSQWLSRANGGASLEDAKHLWSVAPASLLSRELYDAIADHSEIWAWLSEPFWTRWIELWSADPARWSKNAEPFSWLPVGLVLQALRNGRVDGLCHDVRAALWKRMPDELISLIDEHATIAPTQLPRPSNSSGTAGDLVWSAPEQYTAALLERARRWISSPESYPGIDTWIQQWLMHLIQQRSPGWRGAYETLAPWLDQRTLYAARALGSAPEPLQAPAVTTPVRAATKPPAPGRPRSKPSKSIDHKPAKA